MEAERFLTVDGIRLYCQIRGSGPPALLVHGLGMSSYTWRHNIDALAKHFTVYAPDLRGFGHSDRPNKRGYSLYYHQQALLKLLDVLELEQVDYIGSSMGGEIGLRIAINHPHRINRLVLIASAAYREEIPRTFRWLSYLPYRPLVGPWLHRHVLTEPVIRAALREAYYRPERIAEEEMRLMMAPILAQESGPAFQRFIREFDFAKEKARYHEINHSTLILAGVHDRVIPLAHLQRLHRELSNSTLVVVEDSGHLLHEEKPEEINQHILNFLCKKN